MKKAAAKREMTTTVAHDEVEEFLNVQAAKSQFMFATANMGFRLAVTVVVPIVAGVKLDEHFHSAPSLTLTGLFIAVGAGASAVWATIKQVNEEQAKADAEAAKQKKGKATRA